MSTATADVRLENEPTDAAPRRGGLPLGASIYGMVVGVITLAIATPVLLQLDTHTTGWFTFAVLATGAALTQLYVVRTSRDSSFHTTAIFLIPAALLLPPELVVLVAVVQHIPEWLKERYAWYIQSFNICNYSLTVLATWAVSWLILRATFIPYAELRFALAGAAACAV